MRRRKRHPTYPGGRRGGADLGGDTSSAFGRMNRNSPGEDRKAYSRQPGRQIKGMEMKL